jgi:hypothetical protein
MVLLANALDKNIKCQKVFIFKGITAMSWLQVHNYISTIWILNRKPDNPLKTIPTDVLKLVQLARIET